MNITSTKPITIPDSSTIQHSHPLLLLDQVLLFLPSLSTLPSSTIVTTNIPDYQHHQQHQQQQQDDETIYKEQLFARRKRILQTVDFLFSSSPTSSTTATTNSNSTMTTLFPPHILENTLEILDSLPIPIPSSSTHHHDFTKLMYYPVRCIRAIPSHRTIILVRGSSSSSSLKCINTNSISKCSIPIDGAEYICFLGTKYYNPNSSHGHKRKHDLIVHDDVITTTIEHSSKENTTTSTTTTLTTASTTTGSSTTNEHDDFPQAVGRFGYYCSCRSFFEQLKKQTTIHNNNNTTTTHHNGRQLKEQQIPMMERNCSFPLCKHLLAARLAPFLGLKGYREDNVSEEEFSDIMVTLLGG